MCRCGSVDVLQMCRNADVKVQVQVKAAGAGGRFRCSGAAEVVQEEVEGW